MSDTDFEARRAAHRRGHSLPMRERAAFDRLLDAGSNAPRVDVRQFVNDGVLTDDNIDDAIDAAIEAANATAPTGLDGVVSNVYVPPGQYRPSRAHHWPSRGYNIMPGFVCDGSETTVFIVDSDDDASYLFTFGEAEHTSVNGSNAACHRVKIGGFSIVAENEGNCNRGGCSFWFLLYPQLWDIYCSGLYAPSNTHEQGRAFHFGTHRHNDEVINHQHVVARDLLARVCMTGYYLGLMYPGQFYNCGAWACQFENAIIEGAGIEWYGGDTQFAGSVSASSAAWYSGRNMPGVVTGFSDTDGLDSGTGATCGATTSGLCTVTGLSGLDYELDRGRWLELTPAGSSANELTVRGVYKIEEVLSASSCSIRKGSNHTSQGSLTWRVRQSIGGSEILFDGLYDEATDRVASFGFYRCDGQARFTLRELKCHGPDYLFESDGVQYVASENITTLNPSTKHARLRCTNVSALDASIDSIECDFRSYPGMICRFPSPGAGIARGGMRDSNGGRAKRLRSLCAELGAVEIWDARVLSSLSLTGSDVNSFTGLVNGTVLSPGASVDPTYDAADAGFDGPCIINAAGAGANASYLVGDIAAALLPDYLYFPTVVLVARLPNTTLTANGGRSFNVRTPPTGFARYGISFIGFHDAVYMPTGFYTFAQSNNFNNTQGQAAYSLTADTNPHVFIHGQNPYNGSVQSSDAWGVYNSGGYADPFLSFVPGQNMRVTAGFAGHTGTDPLHWAFYAVIPRALSKAEHQQIIDLARNEFPLAES